MAPRLRQWLPSGLEWDIYVVVHHSLLQFLAPKHWSTSLETYVQTNMVNFNFE